MLVTGGQVMPSRWITVQVFRAFQGAVSPAWLRRVMRKALDVVYQSQDCELGLVIADNDTLRGLNQYYRGIDDVTDVLAFPLSRHSIDTNTISGESNIHFITPVGVPETLGDVIISYPQSVLQAQQHGHSVDRELAVLIVHGVLHLLGYDHDQPVKEKLMAAQEAGVLAGIF